ncbi:MAG: Zn-ribbon domain-containing OB-fold protein [Actinobacteria bacterium]|nr:Zn-ribbon domain-containing OB-fold protein [Actinomycetota bacterium]MDI6830560.1 Zn-ribbon domain-containing OB-fold protein [Actinomycetota bacterium]
MGDWREDQELVVMEGRIKVPYRWFAGEVGTRYFESLRDERKFLGTKCGACGKVYHIPRRNCPDCFAECSEWVELGSAGTLETYTVVRRQHPQLAPLPLPYGYGVIRLDGADTGFLHLLYEFEEGGLATGMRVEAVFADEREGRILDVRYFRPTKGVS